VEQPGATMAVMAEPAAVPSPDDLSAVLDEAVRVLRQGGLVAFPTETVYGLGADATNARAVGRIFAAKGRPEGHPLIVHLASVAALDDWAVDVPPQARVLADTFWPGPLTLLLRRSDRVPDVVTGGRDTVGLRVPAHPVARALLERFGGGIAAPSANRFGHVSPTRAEHVRADLGDAVDLVVDGGPCPVGVESTIVDLSRGEVEVVRPGGVSRQEIADALGGAVEVWTGARPVAAPGTLATHYAPRARVDPVDDDGEARARAGSLVDQGMRVGVLAPVAIAGLRAEVVELEPAGQPDAYARVLYERLRQADRLALDVLVVVPPAAAGIGVAVRDRLQRAARRDR
jgi:L-threonylcarbamoyladenylate synthase